MVIVIMGVSGSGKTTVGKKLAEKIGSPFFDADDFHSPANKEKMGKGTALTDEDRFPWLQGIANGMRKWDATNSKTILACSALKQKYRDFLSKEVPVCWVYLKGDKEVIRRRLTNRPNHFMKPELLESQFRDLEEPEKAIVVDIEMELDKIVSGLLKPLSDY